MALRDLLRRRSGAPAPAPVDVAPLAPHEAWAVEAPVTDDDWSVEPGFAPPPPAEQPVEGPAEDAAAWAAAAEPIDVTDHTVELPALAPPPRDLGRRAWRTALTLALALGCAGAALAAGGVLRSKDQMPAPVRIHAAAPARRPAKARSRPKPAARQRRPARPRRAPARRTAAVAPARVPAAAGRAPAPARVAPVRHVVSAPAPRPVAAPKPTPAPAPRPKPTTTTTAQPAPSAPSGEPGRQPPPTP